MDHFTGEEVGMADATEPGPIDYLVVELPDGTTSLTDVMCAELTGLVDGGTVRVLDLLIVRRDDSGAVAVTELEEIGDPGLDALRGSVAEILALEDIENVAAAVAPGRSAVVIIWEYLCARRFACAAASSGARLVAQGRIPTQAIVATLEADDH
ncbi:DUF6325 family protein [Gordonia insulae]|uniref:DUF1269 domain-containing protein n=1 Tax=Gordonia insulae TaxID=2420509 RepID=A0A3G8JSA8_9ACTN|nr:DUF6325 family protein [Gordonia insulae]AZG47372.1 hypothetical protein D7316_03981 [Gordonia insulae]